MRMRLAVTAALLGASLALSARADEEKVPLDKVPAAVMKAVRAKFPKSRIVGAEKEVEGGKTIYEINLKETGQDVDVSVKEDGTIVEIEREIAAADLPKPVAAALKAKYPKGTIKEASEVTEGKTLSFEVIVAVGNKRREVVLDPKGKILEDEEADED